jgi:hypothetical protein
LSLRQDHVRDFVRACVRAGILTDEETYAEARLAITAELPDLAGEVESLADAWISAARDELALEQVTWPRVTDYDRLQSAFGALGGTGVVVLQGCEDHWAAKALLDERAAAGDPPVGIAWFTPPDVWHALDEGMLEVNLWHGTTANVAPGDALLDDVLAVFAGHGLPAHFDEGRIEVSARWQRRIAS